MEDRFIKDVYDTLNGTMLPEYAVPGVENLFAAGENCDRWYARMHEAYARLRQRLSVLDEDEDVEEIISALLDIGQEMALKMFAYGVQFAKEGKV